MRAHIVENGVVVNTIAVDSLDLLPNLIDGTEGGPGWLWDGATLTPPPTPPAPVPSSVSPRQFRQALTRASLRAIVESAVAAADQDTQDWWEYATSIERSNAPLNAMAASLGVTDEALDDLFRSAAAL